MPALEALFDALCTLRDAGDPWDPRYDAEWRVIDRYVHTSWPGGGPEGEELRQETMFAIARSVSRMEAAHPLQAAKWVATIRRHKKIDARRAWHADPVARWLDRGEERALDRVVAHEHRPSIASNAVEQVIDQVLIEVDVMLSERERDPAQRHLDRLRARAAIRRLVLRADFDELLAALDAGEPLSPDRVYKWVERGRPIVLAALERWAARAAEEPAELEIVRTLREIVEARRADAGQPRPGRRRGSPT